MIDEMSNPTLIEYVTCSDDSSEIELELADRLSRAIDEIEALVQDLQQLRAEHGDGA